MAGAASGNIENVYGQTAAGMQTAAQRAQQGIGFQPSGGELVAQAAGRAQQGMGFTPGTLAGADLSAYMNPYQQQVMDVTEANINRQLQGQLGQIGAQAQAARAFGGDRQAVAESLARSEAQRQQAQMAANLGYQGYTQAQALAQQDIQNRLAAEQQQMGAATQLANLANLGFGQQLATEQQQLASANQLANLANVGFGQAQSIEDRMMGYGSAQQQLTQSLINAALGQYGGFTGFPSTALGYTSGALNAVPIPQTTTQTQTPGLFDYLTLGASTLAALPPGVIGPFSDVRLKEKIKRVGNLTPEIGLYEWQWNDEAKRIGVGDQPTVGVIAQEVKDKIPGAVLLGDDGYFRVNYDKIAEAI